MSLAIYALNAAGQAKCPVRTVAASGLETDKPIYRKEANSLNCACGTQLFFREIVDGSFAIYACAVCGAEQQYYVFWHDLQHWTRPAWKLREMAETAKAVARAKMTIDMEQWRLYERLKHTADLVPDQSSEAMPIQHGLFGW